MQRYIWWLLAVLAFAGSGGFMLRARQQSFIVIAMRDERAMILPCNLGIKGSYTARYDELHGKMGRHLLHLRLDPMFKTPEEAKTALRGLQAKVTVRNDDRQVASTIELNAKDALENGAGTQCWWDIEPHERGSYTLELTVLEPAAGLAQRDQQLEGHYQPGVSDNYRILIPLGIAQLLSYAGILFLLTAIIMAIMTWRSRRKQIELQPGEA